MPASAGPGQVEISQIRADLDLVLISVEVDERTVQDLERILLENGFVRQADVAAALQRANVGRPTATSNLLVTNPSRDMGAGELILQELAKALAIPVELVAIEDLEQVLSQKKSATVVTSRYFLPEAESIASPYATRVLPIDIYDYGKELAIIKELPKDTRLGIVSLSPGIIRVAEILIHSLRGDDLLLITAQVGDRRQLLTLARSAQTIMSDPASYDLVKEAILTVRDDIIRPPDIFCSEYYIGEKSINLLKRELGLG